VPAYGRKANSSAFSGAVARRLKARRSGLSTMPGRRVGANPTPGVPRKVGRMKPMASGRSIPMGQTPKKPMPSGLVKSGSPLQQAIQRRIEKSKSQQ